MGKNTDNLAVILISTIVAVFMLIVVVIFSLIIFRRMNVKKNFSVNKDINPTYGNNTEYEGYYTETKLTNENKYYQSEDYYGDDSEIRENNVVYK